LDLQREKIVGAGPTIRLAEQRQDGSGQDKEDV
jgi:hypothetical protein